MFTIDTSHRITPLPAHHSNQRNTAMTITTTLSTLHLATSPRPMTRDRHDDVAAVPSAVKSEWIKLRSLRSTPAILGLTVVVGILLSWILATFVKTDPNTHEVFTIGQTFIFSTWLTTVLAIVMGTLLFTSEVQHGTLANTVAAQPARWVTVAAKATVGACLGLAMGIVGMVAGFGGAVLGGLQAGNTSGVVATALWGLLLTTLAPVFGLGVGMIIRHSAAAASTVLVWALLVENLIKGFAPATLTRLMTFSAANGLLGIQAAGDTPATMAAALSRTNDAFLFSGYTLAAVAIGTVLLYRRDPH
jgi:ABC-2 type transport system permease protein